MIIGFIGSQNGMTQFQKTELAKILKLKECTELITRDYKGSEHEAVHIAIRDEIKQFTFALSNDERKRAYQFTTKDLKDIFDTFIYQGNNINARWYKPTTPTLSAQRVVDDSAMIVACPKEFKFSVRSFTWATIKYSWKLQKDVVIIPPIERPENENNEGNSSN